VSLEGVAEIPYERRPEASAFDSFGSTCQCRHRSKPFAGVEAYVVSERRVSLPARVRIVLVLGLLDAVGPLSIDLYVPAFPELQRDLRLNDLAVQLTLASMTAGLALGQAVVGTWSDRVGRRRPLLLASALYVAGAIVCTGATSIQVLLLGRVAQGVGAAGAAVLVLAIVRDLSDGSRFVALLTRVTLITTTAPLIAPVAGALLLPLIGWRGLFGLLALLGAVLLGAVALVLPETLVRTEAAPTSRLRRVLRDRRFLAATGIGAATYAGVYAYVAASPLLLRNVLGLSAAEFAVTFLVGSLGLLAGVQIGGRMAERTSGRAVLVAAAAVALLAAAALLPAQRLGLPGVAPCLWLFVAACGASFPSAAAIALQDQAARAGTATSVYGCTTFAAAAAVSSLPGLIGITDAAPVAAVLSGTAAASLVVAAVALRPAESPSG
jgi:DHA1 family bicyclomycin/chloramphenicol resistance-like MFS transporter